MSARDDSPSLTVREARRRFFAANGFGQDGGYDDAWADAEFGPFTYRVPNVPARGRALRVHDLHHLVTGYPTDWRGEAQISAWELGSGWGRYPYAWIIALFGVLSGLLALPAETWRAFVRGRRSRGNLYGARSIDAWLDRPLADLERTLAVPEREGAARSSDAVVFGLTSAAALAFGLFAAPGVAILLALGEARRIRDRAGCPFGAASCA